MNKRVLPHADSDTLRSPRLKLSDTWESHLSSKATEVKKKQYIVFSVQAFNSVAEQLQTTSPDRFVHFPIDWGKFPDGTDDITIGGFHPTNLVAGENILFLASFHNNDVTLSQFSVLITLLQSFIESLTIVLPFFPVGTNERVELEGKVSQRLLPIVVLNLSHNSLNSLYLFSYLCIESFICY